MDIFLSGEVVVEIFLSVVDIFLSGEVVVEIFLAVVDIFLSGDVGLEELDIFLSGEVGLRVGEAADRDVDVVVRTGEEAFIFVVPVFRVGFASGEMARPRLEGDVTLSPLRGETARPGSADLPSLLPYPFFTILFFKTFFFITRTYASSCWRGST